MGHIYCGYCWENNIKMDFNYVRIWTKLICLWIGSTGGLLLGISGLAERLLASQ
jgi:hypothetical protein